MDWNVITTVHDQRGLRRARRFLSRYGEVTRTDFHNVLVLHVPDIEAFLEAMASALEDRRRHFQRHSPHHAGARDLLVRECPRIRGQGALDCLPMGRPARRQVISCPPAPARAGETSAKLRSHAEEVFLDNVIAAPERGGTVWSDQVRGPDYALDI